MAVLDYGRDDILAVHLLKTYCLPILLCGCEIWCMSPSDKHKVDVAWNNGFRKIVMLVGEKMLSHSYFIATPCLLRNSLNRKNDFYNKTLHSNTTVLRILCALHRNEARKLSSVYHIFPGHSSSIDTKRAVWSSFVSLLTV